MSAVCPYCRTAVAPGEGTTCEACGTPHHQECFEENGGCTLFGCKFAPPDDPKVEISSTEVAYSMAAAGARPTGFGDVSGGLQFTMPAPVMTGPPPPPPPGAVATASAAVAAAAPAPAPAPGSLFNAQQRPARTRLTFILLGIFLGMFGAHNFYAGYWKRACVQVAVTVLTLFYAAFVVWLWALVEVCTVDADSNNVSFA